MPIVAVEGLLGVGKSSLCAALARTPGIVTHPEPVGDDPLLASYYADPKGYALTFQLYVLMHRAAEHARAQKLDKVRLFDRSILGDFAIATLHVAEGNIDSLAAIHYFDVYRKVTAALDPPAAVVYLDASPETVLARIRERGRKAEAAVSLEWVRKVQRGYEIQLEAIGSGRHPWAGKTKVVRVPWERPDPRDVLEALAITGVWKPLVVDTYLDFSPRPVMRE